MTEQEKYELLILSQAPIRNEQEAEYKGWLLIKAAERIRERQAVDKANAD